MPTWNGFWVCPVALVLKRFLSARRGEGTEFKHERFRDKHSACKRGVGLHARRSQLCHLRRKVSEDDTNVHVKGWNRTAGGIPWPALLAPERGHGTGGQAALFEQPCLCLKQSSFEKDFPKGPKPALSYKSHCSCKPWSLLACTDCSLAELQHGSSQASPPAAPLLLPGAERAELPHGAFAFGVTGRQANTRFPTRCWCQYQQVRGFFRGSLAEAALLRATEHPARLSASRD